MDRQKELTRRHKEREQIERERELLRRQHERENRGHHDLDLSLVIPDAYMKRVRRPRRSQRIYTSSGWLDDVPSLIRLVDVKVLEKEAVEIFHQSKRLREEDVPGLFRLTKKPVEDKEPSKMDIEANSSLMEADLTTEDENGLSTLSRSVSSTVISDVANSPETPKEKETEIWDVESTGTESEVKTSDDERWIMDEEKTESESIVEYSVI